MSDITQKIDGDVSGLEKELGKLQREIIKLREENAKTARQSVEDSRQQERALKRLGETVKRDLETPTEAYKRKVGQLKQAHKAGELGVEEYTRAARKLSREVRGFGSGFETATQRQNNFLASAGRIGAVVLSYVGLRQAIAAVNVELERRAQLEGRSLDQHVSIATAQSMLVNNLQGTDEENRQVVESIKAIQGQVGFRDRSPLFQAAAAGISGGATTENIAGFVKAGAELSIHEPGQLQTLVGAGIDISSISGVEDPRKAIGLMLSAGAVSRPDSLAAQARNIPQAITGVAGTDETADRETATREGAAAFAALSKSAKDTKGEMAATGAVSLAVQMREFFQAEGQTDPATFGGRLRALQGDEALRSKFLENANFEQKLRIPSEQLITGGTQTARMFEEALGGISFDEKAFERKARQQKTLTPELRSATKDAAEEGRLQSRLAENVWAADSANVRELHKNAIEQSTRGMVDATINNPIHNVAFGSAVAGGMDPLLAARSSLSDRVEMLRTGSSFLPSNSEELRNRPDAALGPEAQKQLDDLRNSLKQLDDQIKQARAGGARLQDQEDGRALEAARAVYGIAYGRDAAQQTRSSEFHVFAEAVDKFVNAFSSKTPNQQTTAVAVDQHR